MWYECVCLSACVLTARERQDLDWAPKVERRKPFQLVLKTPSISQRDSGHALKDGEND